MFSVKQATPDFVHKSTVLRHYKLIRIDTQLWWIKTFVSIDVSRIFFMKNYEIFGLSSELVTLIKVDWPFKLRVCIKFKTKESEDVTR